MKLDCYALTANPPPLIPAPSTRDWMDSNKATYRCLPMTIANSHGWQLLCRSDVFIEWNGGPRIQDVIVRGQGCVSHFSRGILTFHTDYLFRTEPGWSTLVSGPTNQPKDGIAALAGIVETFWSSSTFTMNWQFTRPGSVIFEKDEPFCQIMPIPQDYLRDVTPRMLAIADNPELAKEYAEWRDSRNKFNADPQRGDKWQKDYFREADVSKVRVKAAI